MRTSNLQVTAIFANLYIPGWAHQSLYIILNPQMPSTTSVPTQKLSHAQKEAKAPVPRPAYGDAFKSTLPRGLTESRGSLRILRSLDRLNSRPSWTNIFQRFELLALHSCILLQHLGNQSVFGRRSFRGIQRSRDPFPNDAPQSRDGGPKTTLVHGHLGTSDHVHFGSSCRSSCATTTWQASTARPVVASVDPYAWR